MAVNLKAPFFLVAAVAPPMIAQAGGTIFNLGSWIARLGIPVGALYRSTKGAVETLTRAWASAFGPLAFELTLSPRRHWRLSARGSDDRPG
jgi:NAD(P)-dependent dehydrogenase (short-subunit alcohol dehydrogenase family)